MSISIDFKKFYEEDIPEPYRNSWLIDALPNGFKKLSEAYLEIGDAVTWEEHPDAHHKGQYYTPAYVHKHHGIVLATKWFRINMTVMTGLYTKRTDTFSPMALILWGDGETTSTSQSCLVKLY